eukprot:Gb_17159 [translate_table: standard]
MPPALPVAARLFRRRRFGFRRFNFPTAIHLPSPYLSHQGRSSNVLTPSLEHPDLKRSTIFYQGSLSHHRSAQPYEGHLKVCNNTWSTHAFQGRPRPAPMAVISLQLCKQFYASNDLTAHEGFLSTWQGPSINGHKYLRCSICHKPTVNNYNAKPKTKVHRHSSNHVASKSSSSTENSFAPYTTAANCNATVGVRPLQAFPATPGNSHA